MGTIWNWVKTFCAFIIRLILHLIVMLGPWAILIFLLGLILKALSLTSPFAIAIAIVCIIFILVCKLSWKIIPITGCNLKTNWVLKNICVVTTCTSTKCFEIPGPYPSILGGLAFFTQAAWCICPAIIGIPPGKESFFQDLINRAQAIKDESELRKLILDIEREMTLTPRDIDPEVLRRIYRAMQKIQNHESLTQEDYDAINELFR